MTRTVEELRKAYQESIQHAHKAYAFWDEMNKYQGTQGIFLAYKATALALKARHDWNPYNKLNWLNEAMNIFREAVNEEPQNIEIRFLRFAIQHYVPDFLNQSQHLSEDKAVILDKLGKYQDFSLSLDHLGKFYEFFAESKRFSREELTKIQEFIKNNT